MSSTLNVGCFRGGNGDLEIDSVGNTPSNATSIDLEAGGHVRDASGKKVVGGVISSIVAVVDSYYFCKMQQQRVDVEYSCKSSNPQRILKY
jgi:hypothetical protein